MSSYTQLQYEKHMSNFCSPILTPITNPHTLLDIKKQTTTTTTETSRIQYL